MQYYNKEKVGKRIQEIRKERNLTQEALARKLDYLGVRQIQRIENGVSGCSIDKIMKISQVLHITTDYLLSDGWHTALYRKKRFVSKDNFTRG